jgi:hypothetical protein
MEEEKILWWESDAFSFLEIARRMYYETGPT